MKKHLIIGSIIGLVLVAATYMLLTNSHADFFSATYTVSPTADEFCEGDTGKDMISLMYLDDYDRCFDYSLTGAGYVTAFFVVFVLPMLLGLLIGRLFRKK